MTTATRKTSKKKKAGAAPQPESTPIIGYRPRPRYRDVTLTTIPHEDGGQPFSARIRAHLTFGQMEEIPYGPGVAYRVIEDAIAPYVVGWNVMAENVESGQLEPVPPPAEAGVDAFKFIGGAEVEWLALELKTASLGSIDELNEREKNGTLTPEQAAAKKDLAPFASTPEQSGAESSV